MVQSRLREGSNTGKQHPISNLLPQHPQHSPPGVCYSPGPRHSRRSSASPARARTEGRADEVPMAPGRSKVAGGRLERETRALRSRRAEARASGIRAWGGTHQVGNKPAGCQPICSSAPPRHTVLWVCGETLRAGSRVAKGTRASQMPRTDQQGCTQGMLAPPPRGAIPLP